MNRRGGGYWGNGAEPHGEVMWMGECLGASDLQFVLEQASANGENPKIDERLFLSRATEINEILHLGAVNPHHRAGVMAALLLSKSE